MKRRNFIMMLAGAVAARSVTQTRAQPSGQIRRIGMLSGGSEGDPLSKIVYTWYTQDLVELGWTEGRNLRLDVRWGAGEPERMGAFAKELIALRPDVLIVSSPAATKTVQSQTKIIPIVFTGVGDPVASGVLNNVARPEGNATGVTNYFPSISGKWLELLKEAAPRVSRVGLIFNPDISTGAYFAALEAAASQLAVNLVKIPYHDAADLVHAIDTFSAEPGGGLILLPPAPNDSNRALINRLAVQHTLPTLSGVTAHAAEGTLVAYGSDTRDNNRRAASYVDRLLRGAKPADLPVQFPTKFELVFNLKTAKAMGLTIPAGILLRADNLIE